MNQSVPQPGALSDHRSLILMYHRVSEVEVDPWALCVTPGHFAEQLEVLQKDYFPMSLRQLVRDLQNGSVPPRSVIVTFDDGYSDNFHNAKPSLDRFETPATVFLASGYLGQRSEFWWDELERLFLQPGELPESLQLTINEESQTWELGDEASYSEDDYRLHCQWKASDDAPTVRHSLYRSLWQTLQPLQEGERRKVLGEIVTWANADPDGRPTHRTLSFQELEALAQDDLIEIGSHTVTHPVLSALPAASQKDEILLSKAKLEELLKCSVTSFAYPYGAQSNYTEETISLVKEAGFNCACATLQRGIGSDTDRFQLPRIQVEDCDGEVFSRWLSEWFKVD